MKPQVIRLIDVAVIGPIMIWGGYALRKQSKFAGNTLIFFGASTVVYNLINYLNQQTIQSHIEG